MTEHWTWWGRNLEFQFKFFWSSQKPLPYTVKGIPSAYQWKKCLKWLKNVTSCIMSWVLLENFRKVFTKTSTFARKHQWQCRERRFRNIQNFRLSEQDGQFVKNVWKESLIMMNHSWNCGKNVWKKSWIKKQGNDFGLQEPNGNLFFFRHQSIIWALHMTVLSLQSKKVLAIKGKKFADLVIDILRSMRNDEDFDSFSEVVKKVANPIKLVGKPT